MLNFCIAYSVSYRNNKLSHNCREGSDEEAEAGREEEEDDESGCMTNRLVLPA